MTLLAHDTTLYPRTAARLVATHQVLAENLVLFQIDGPKILVWLADTTWTRRTLNLEIDKRIRANHAQKRAERQERHAREHAT